MVKRDPPEHKFIWSGHPFVIEGEINFMSCDQEQCVFPMPVNFSFQINTDGTIVVEKTEEISSQDIENTKKCCKYPYFKL